MQRHANGTTYAISAAMAEKPDLVFTSRGAGANWPRPKLFGDYVFGQNSGDTPRHTKVFADFATEAAFFDKSLLQ